MARCINIYCGTKENLTQHHLIPKSYRNMEVFGGRRVGAKIILCDQCHKRVHQLKTNGDLAANYNTKGMIIELLGSDVLFRVQRLINTSLEMVA